MKPLKFKYNINEAPKSKLELLLLSVQHVFAMFGSTILVPTLIGIDVATSLFTAGVGTLIYSQVTKKKVPVFIGSSFAYIAILTQLNQEFGANGIANAVISVGLIYVFVSFTIRLFSDSWIDKILPPIVIGPVIMVIGLSLSPTAIQNSGLLNGGEWYDIIISFTALISGGLVLLTNDKILKSIPIIVGILSGYVMALFLDIFIAKQIVDTSVIMQHGLFYIPNFQVPFITYSFSFNISTFITVIPIVLVTMAEHIGDHSVSSSMMNKNFLKDPGLSKTLLGDGLATLFAGLVGGVVNTTYAENTGVIMLTRIASITVIRVAAVLAIILAFLGPISGFIISIPSSVMGGISILLFGMIAQNGIRIIMHSNIDISHSRNLIISSVILVTGLGGAIVSISLGSMSFTFDKMSLAALLGIFLHLILPQKEASYPSK